MGRAPCCEKMGLKKGPWTPEEDQLLINYINLHGHGNWRALPKQAGLLRCGKSCRLRWINYLRPDIKRGNFTKEEEDTIINLHQMLGNRWAAIAARLPGRTDNEIKNVWHTHLKKRLVGFSNDSKRQETKKEQVQLVNIVPSPPESSSDISTSEDNSSKMERSDEELSEIDDHFWSEVLCADYSNMAGDFPVVASWDVSQPQYLTSSLLDYGSNVYEYDFWHNLFYRGGDLHQLPEI